MGVVYKAEDLRLHRPVALKLLLPDLMAREERRLRFLREARAAAAVSHPHIATVYEIDEADGVVFIAMEYLEGKTLRARLSGRPLPIREALRLATQIAEGLARAHQGKVIHRDLKPENVIVGAEGQVKILDFGLAKLLEETPEVASQMSAAETITGQMTREGEVLGTAPYMSPEQARGLAVDARSDLFSFGVMLYEMVTGRRPFRGTTSRDTINALINQQPVPAARISPDVPAELERILSKCLEKEPAGRYQDSPDLLVDLRRLSRELESGSMPADGQVRGVEAPRRRRGWGVVLAGAMTVIAAVIAAWWVERTLLTRTAGAGDSRTILILPLEVRGQVEGADYVGRAFAEALAVNLARAKNLSVLPVPGADEAGRGQSRSPVRAAVEAGAGRLVTGAVVRDAKGLHASVSLLDTERNRIVWGTEKSAEADDFSGLAASMSRDLSTELGGPTTRLYDIFWYSAGSPELAASPDFSAVLAACRRIDFAGGLASAKRLVESFPNDPRVRALHLLFLFWPAASAGPASPERGEFEKGAAALTRVDPDTPWVDHFRAQLLNSDGRFAESAAVFTRLLARADLSPAARAIILSIRGQAYSLLGRADLALADLKEGLPLDPASDVNRAIASGILERLGRDEEALTHARNGFALNPESYQNNHRLGVLLYKLRRWEEAIPALRKACEINPVAWVCAYHALALLRAGHSAEAKAAAERAAALQETPDGAFVLACFHAVSGDRDGAIRLLRRHDELAPLDHPDLMKDQDLVSLHGDPDFEKMQEKHRRRGFTPW